MIIEKKTYWCTKCNQPMSIETSLDTGENYCKKCGHITEHGDTYLFNTETRRVVKYLYEAPPDQDMLKRIQPKSKPVVTCPYCKSTNTRKLGIGSKAISAGLFGIFALPSISKQWICRDCKSEF